MNKEQLIEQLEAAREENTALCRYCESDPSVEHHRTLSNASKFLKIQSRIRALETQLAALD